MARGIDRVRSFVDNTGIEAKIFEFDRTTKTSQHAAEALGCEVAQIAKSIVFTDDSLLVVVISGDRRVDPTKLSTLVRDDVSMADPETVKRLTGYSIGGVPPFPHQCNVKVFIDLSVDRYRAVWVAAGAPNAVMKVRVDALKSIIGAEFVDVAKD
ncbi:MAG: YbaK/EbsC family protein [Candidatus Bathyarchaeia archaeon]